MKVLAFLKNKYVLYTLIFLGVLNVLGYVALEDYNSTALFIVVILLSNYFSSNQSLNILVAILVTSLVAINHRFREGFQEGGKILLNRTALGTGNVPKQKEKKGSPKNVFLEASGGINLETLTAYASTGVDAISIGALTTLAKNIDLKMEFKKNSE